MGAKPHAALLGRVAGTAVPSGTGPAHGRRPMREPQNVLSRAWMGHRVRVQGRGELGDHESTSQVLPEELSPGGLLWPVGTCVCPEEGGETPPLGLRVEPMGSEPSASLEGLRSSRRPSRKGKRDSWEPHRVPWFHFVRAGSSHPSLRWSWGGSGGPRISGTASWESADRCCRLRLALGRTAENRQMLGRLCARKGGRRSHR